MDEVDRKLLALLQQDATVAMAELAEQVGLSATPVWKRIQKLEQAGVILGRVAHGAAALGWVAAVAVVIAINAPAAPSEGPATGYRCDDPGCPHDPGSHAAHARERDIILDRLGAIDLTEQIPD